MRGHVFVALGDLTRLSADAIAYSTDSGLRPDGQLASAFFANVPGFEALYEELGGRARASKPQAGDTFWIELAGKRPAGVVVTIATGRALPRSERARVAVTNALCCAADHLARRGIAKPWLIALPTFLTGDGGARHDRLTVAEPQVEAAEEFLDAHDDVDVAFVPYVDSNYQVWLEARRRVHARRVVPSGGDDPVEPDPALVDALRRGECVLFIGAGVSLSSGLPAWSDLVTELADELKLPPEARRADLDYFLDLAQWYREEGHGVELEARIAKRFTAASTGAKPTLAHYLLASLPARYYVTTNFDDLLENALDALRRSPIRVVDEHDVAKTGGPDGSYVVKFHGCAATGGSIVLSRDDYDDFFRTRPAMASLLEGLLLNQSFFYVGYGLRDPDFRQLHNRVSFMLREAKRPGFATTFEATTDHPRRQWRTKHLEIVDVPGTSAAQKARNLDRFLDRLAERVAEDPQLFLADDVERSSLPEIDRVRDGLLALAPAVLEACNRAATAGRGEVKSLASVLDFLCARGFRGHYPGQLAGVYQALARHADLPSSERRALLVRALRHTESFGDAAAVKLELAALDRARS